MQGAPPPRARHGFSACRLHSYAWCGFLQALPRQASSPAPSSCASTPPPAGACCPAWRRRSCGSCRRPMPASATSRRGSWGRPSGRRWRRQSRRLHSGAPLSRDSAAAGAAPDWHRHMLPDDAPAFMSSIQGGDQMTSWWPSYCVRPLAAPRVVLQLQYSDSGCRSRPVGRSWSGPWWRKIWQQPCARGRGLACLPLPAPAAAQRGASAPKP